jgi:hypothetical protein
MGGCAYGATSSSPWLTQEGRQAKRSSTVLQFVRIARLLAEKGGAVARYRAFAWRPDHKNPRNHGPPLPPDQIYPDGWPCSPPKSNRRYKPGFSPALYRDRNAVERSRHRELLVMSPEPSIHEVK